MFSKVVNTTLTPSQSLSPPGDASPSPSSLILSPPTQAPPQVSASELRQSNVRAPSQTSSATPTGVVKNLMHKNELNTYCQRLRIPLPVYQNAFEGSCHALRFRSIVSVGKKNFASPNTFSNQKSAELAAAKLALQYLLKEDEAIATNMRGNLRKLVCQDKARCKMILNEFLTKIKMECAYETIQVETTPMFVSSLAVNGTCYKGECGKNKKEAEQLAALAAILSLFDDPTYATTIFEVTKSKFNARAVFNELKDFPNSEFKAITSNSDSVPLTHHVVPTGQSSFRVLVDEQMPTPEYLQANNIEAQGCSGILLNENKKNLLYSVPQTKKQVRKNQRDLLFSLPQPEKRGGQGILVDKQGVAGHRNEGEVNSCCFYANQPEAVQRASQQISVPIKFVPPAIHSVATDLISSKKRRRKNKKKANKRLRAEDK